MKKLFLAFALVACFAVSALSQGAPPWTIQEVDGSPRVNSPTLIKVTNGTLSCTGKTCTITISGGGGGSPGGSNTQCQYNNAGSFGGVTGCTSDGTNVTFGSANLRATRPRFITSIDDTNGNEVFIITATGSAVNEVTIANAATGNNPTFTASGGDANVGINFVPKGSGTIQVSGAAIVTVSATQTLTNKTLTTPIIAQISNTGTLTLPTSTDTLVGRATTDTLTNKTLSTSNTVSAALTWTAGVKQTFAPDATTAGINVGSVAGNPSGPSNADLWYNTATNELYARINGANVALGSGGGSGANPTASVGLSAVNGVATTFMRSDAAPPLDQAITPTWTGQHIWSLSNAAAVAIGPNGNTNPVFRVVTNVASAATGVSITGNAAGAGVDIQVTSSAAIDNLNIRTKGAGQISFFNNAIETFRLWTQSTSLFGTHIRYQNGVGGTSKAFWDLSNVNFRLASDGYYGFSSSTDATGAGDWRLYRLAAGVARIGGSSATDAGNLLVGTSAGAIGTSGAGVLAFTLSTEPSTSPTDTTQLYYKDFAAGDGRLYLRNEASAAGSPVANLGDAQTFTGRITFSPGATVAGINVGSVAGNPSAPSNADLWYNTATNELYARINGANVALGSGGGGGITIGTTTITSGTNTRVLYNNSGVVGEYVITGTGNVMMSASPTTTGRLTAADANFTTAVTTGSGTTAGLQVTADSLTTGNGAEFSSSSVSSGNVVRISATGTAAASNTKTALSVATSGANGTSTQTTYGAQISNTSTGTSSTNIGLSVSASGGTNNTAINVGAGQVLLDNGTASLPGIAWRAVNTVGFYIVSGAQFRWAMGGTARGEFNSDSIHLLTNTGQYRVGSSNDVILRRSAAANWAFGDTDAASPVAQTLSVQNVVGGTSNTAGVTTTIRGSLGTSQGVPGRIHLQAGGLIAASGTTQQTALDRLVTGASKVLTNNSAITIANVTAGSNTSVGGRVDYCVEVFDGTDVQYECGSATYGVSNKGGVFSGNTVTKFGNHQNATAGTLTVTFAISGANPALLSVNANSSLTPSTGFPRITYSLQNLGQQAVAIQ